MRIKQLELHGFKSFKDRTTLAFPPGITAIVGPNGCGKSNLVDALRWVLGEQSPRHLRGQEMGDVIFNGNDTHAPLGMAEVSFMLENNGPAVGTNGTPEVGTNGESIASLIGGFSEVTITRRYFRSGESAYFINKVPCRLKDIVELFLGSGAGTKAYSIIEQGRVDRLINARPEEIRLFIEEAAGVSLYRSRRQAAERKLERTRDNLLRVTDIMREMERQLATLRRQAKKAEQYQAYQRELREVDLLLSYHAFTCLQAEAEETGSRGEEVASRETAVRERRLQMEADHRRCEEVLARIGEEMRGCEARLHLLERELSQGEQRVGFLREKAIELAQRLNTLEEQKKELSLRQEQVSAEVARIDQQQLELQQLAQQDEAALKEIGRELSGLQQALVTCEEQEEEIKSALVDLLTQEARVKNTLLHIEGRSKEAEDQLLALQQDGERITHHLIAAEEKVVAARSRLDSLYQQAETKERARQEKIAALRLTVLEGEQCDERLLDARARQTEVGSRLETLREMERKFTHYPQAVQTMMGQENGERQNILGVMAQVFEVPQAYERAVAAVLGEKLECIIVTDVEQGVEAVKHLCASQGGRGSFVPLTPRWHNGFSLPITNESGQSEVLPLLKVISVSEEYQEIIEVLMGSAVVVSDLATGLRLWQQDGGQHTFVTLRGEVLSPQGMVSGGSEAPATEEILEHRRKIRELAQAMVHREEEVAHLTDWRQEIKKKQQTLEEEIQELEIEARERSRNVDALQREQGQLEGEHRRLLDRQEGVEYERQALLADQQTFAQEREANKKELANLASARQEQEGALTCLQEEIARTQTCSEETRAAGDETRVRVAERRERGESLGHHMRRLKEEGGDLSQRLTSCQSEGQTLGEEQVRVEKEQLKVARWLTEKGGERGTIEQEYAHRRDIQEEATTEAHRLVKLVVEFRQEEEQLRDERSQLEVALAEKRAALGHVRETVREKYGVEIEEALTALRQEKETEKGDRETEIGSLFLPDSFDRDMAEQRRSELKEKIARLGEVNPTALSERAQLEERYGFVQEQEKDLRSSLDDLQRTITKLNRESRERFRATFVQANEKLQEVYGRLVEGGKAHLVLQEETQVLDSGVEVVVQPPGKRLHTLQLLSGGEKALAALSFIFALFLIRPSPFCFLDEVDAPLDDANVARFGQLVRDMSQEVQIVLITHNKRTMEAADTLYGVTMHEPGFSTVVSVQMG